MNNLALTYRAFGIPEEQLSLEEAKQPEREPGNLRVAMMLAPVNPSDLIPITGAYAHRTALPQVAGYEGVGRVVDAPTEHSYLIGRRVLPLRASGTWQTFADCDPAYAVQVPDTITDDVAARAYINPLAAWLMLSRWPVTGRRVVLSGAGSLCSDLLGYWAKQLGALEVVGIYRSENRVTRLRALGTKPVPGTDKGAILHYARDADVVFDSLGGPLASLILEAMQEGARFVGYGLLTGRIVRPQRTPKAHYERFHLRDALYGVSADTWKKSFAEIWPLLAEFSFPKPRFFALERWRQAIDCFEKPGEPKPILVLNDKGR